jgi:phosphoesterase RecJ-like protein
LISLTELSSRIFNEKSVAIFTHIRPDGDAIGSALALKCAFLGKGVKADLYIEDEIPEKYKFLVEDGDIKKQIDDEYSALIAVDCAEESRLGNYVEYFLKHPNTYNVDHHISNTRYAKINYVKELSSNAENILEIIRFGDVQPTKRIVNLLALGIVTDTGNFKHKNVSEFTLLSVALLVKYGADLNAINYNAYTKQTKARAKLFGLVMGKIRYALNDKFAIATVTQVDLQNTGAKADETEGFVDFIMGIETVEVGACIMEMGVNKYKISFRSKMTDVNGVASTFGGGGHKLASGCQIQGNYEDVIDKITFAVSRYIEE